eukprot:3383764-Amphidinium_carterae.1
MGSLMCSEVSKVYWLVSPSHLQCSLIACDEPAFTPQILVMFTCSLARMCCECVALVAVFQSGR